MKQLFFLLILSFTMLSACFLNAQNWQIQNSNFPPNVLVVDFSPVNDQVCWAVGQVFPGNTAPYSGFIKTNDGGDNWICDSISGITNCYFQEIFAVDADTAYATLYKLLGTSGTDRGIYKTTDGGMSWYRQNAFNSSQSGPGIMHFFDSQNGVIIGDPYLEAYATTNGGLTWNSVTLPAALPDEYTLLGENRIAAVGNTVWFYSDHRLFKSTDKGYTWTVLVDDPSFYGWGASISFQDQQTGIYALKIGGGGTNHIYKKTTDGGATWDTLSNSILDNLAPSNIQHIPGTSSAYIAVGGRTPTMRGAAVTYDAGESWTLIDTLGVFFINFINGTVGWGSQYGTNAVYKYVGTPLPVELTSLTATINGREVILNWSTASELNSLGFEIQRSADRKEFSTIGFVKGHGTTTGQHSYTYSDKNLENGKYYYRLKQVDFNGSIEYSDVIELEWRAFNSYLLEQNYPNPFNPTTTIGFGIQEKSNVKITILNAIGEEVAVVLNEVKEAGYHTVEFNASSLPSGVYFYQLRAVDPSAGSGQAFIQTKKMILLK